MWRNCHSGSCTSPSGISAVGFVMPWRSITTAEKVVLTWTSLHIEQLAWAPVHILARIDKLPLVTMSVVASCSNLKSITMTVFHTSKVQTEVYYKTQYQTTSKTTDEITQDNNHVSNNKHNIHTFNRRITREWVRNYTSTGACCEYLGINFAIFLSHKQRLTFRYNTWSNSVTIAGSLLQ